MQNCFYTQNIEFSAFLIENENLILFFKNFLPFPKKSTFFSLNNFLKKNHKK